MKCTKHARSYRHDAAAVDLTDFQEFFCWQNNDISSREIYLLTLLYCNALMQYLKANVNQPTLLPSSDGGGACHDTPSSAELPGWAFKKPID